MLVLLSPSKRLDEKPTLPDMTPTQPALLDKATALAGIMKKKTAADLKKLMGVSDAIATLNVQRFKDFKTPFTPQNALPALFLFKGDVYDNMDVHTYKKPELDFAQKHVRILSGLYGVLRPMDLMQPYRLEMGTTLETKTAKNLYGYWGDAITEHLNADLNASGDDTVINLASTEYFSAVKPTHLNGRLLTLHFKQNKGGSLKTIGLMAKRARGMMCNYIIKHHITDPEKLKGFTGGGYVFRPELSEADSWVFTLNMK
ncbi:MAG: peroxide stress protein YaaA [Proteobacteria bacterium]|nr:peroxide stress protein YaaA [Pseudomonadota bacterium]